MFVDMLEGIQSHMPRYFRKTSSKIKLQLRKPKGKTTALWVYCEVSHINYTSLVAFANSTFWFGGSDCSNQSEGHRRLWLQLHHAFGTSLLIRSANTDCDFLSFPELHSSCYALSDGYRAGFIHDSPDL
jgi:hypothetical protein